MYEQFEGDEQLIISCCIYLMVRTSLAIGITAADVIPYAEAMFVGDLDGLAKVDAAVMAKKTRKQ